MCSGVISSGEQRSIKVPHTVSLRMQLRAWKVPISKIEWLKIFEKSANKNLFELPFLKLGK
jgi:hypothetical protein